jgi:hypothetical protein
MRRTFAGITALFLVGTLATASIVVAATGTSPGGSIATDAGSKPAASNVKKRHSSKAKAKAKAKAAALVGSAFSALAATPPDTSEKGDELRVGMQGLRGDTFREIRVAKRTSDYTYYVVWGAKEVCTWLQTKEWGTVGCSLISEATNPKTPLATTFRYSPSEKWTVVALVTDAVANGELAARSPERQVVRSGNVIETTASSGEQVAIDSPDGTATINVAQR